MHMRPWCCSSGRCKDACSFIVLQVSIWSQKCSCTISVQNHRCWHVLTLVKTCTLTAVKKRVDTSYTVKFRHWPQSLDTKLQVGLESMVQQHRQADCWWRRAISWDLPLLGMISLPWIDKAICATEVRLVRYCHDHTPTCKFQSSLRTPENASSKLSLSLTSELCKWVDGECRSLPSWHTPENTFAKCQM